MLRCLLLMPFYLKVCVVSDGGGVSLSLWEEMGQKWKVLVFPDPAPGADIPKERKGGH